jgi:hypothetical protein
VKPVFENISILGRDEIARIGPAEVLKSLAVVRGQPTVP